MTAEREGNSSQIATKIQGDGSLMIKCEACERSVNGRSKLDKVCWKMTLPEYTGLQNEEGSHPVFWRNYYSPPERRYEKVAVEESRVMKAKGCGVGRIVRGLQENPSP